MSTSHSKLSLLSESNDYLLNYLYLLEGMIKRTKGNIDINYVIC